MNKEVTKMEFFNRAYNIFVEVSLLKILLLDDKVCKKKNYASVKSIIKLCKNEFEDIINIIEKDCCEEKE